MPTTICETIKYFMYNYNISITDWLIYNHILIRKYMFILMLTIGVPQKMQYKIYV